MSAENFKGNNQLKEYIPFIVENLKNKTNYFELSTKINLWN